MPFYVCPCKMLLFEIQRVLLHFELKMNFARFCRFVIVIRPTEKLGTSFRTGTSNVSFHFGVGYVDRRSNLHNQKITFRNVAVILNS